MNVINYQKEYEKEVEILKNSGQKPHLLLHVCCGPCSTYPLVLLHESFHITILYTNSNIYPKEEFDKRFMELVKYVSFLNKDYPKEDKILVILDDYQNDEFSKDLEVYKDEEEGHNRCHICFEKRLRRLFLFAKEKGYPYVTTVMTISRHKNAEYLNKLGLRLEEEYCGPKYLLSDFKKFGGEEKARLITLERKLYKQDYCGCKFSKK